jgi:hypothetical protein
MDVVRESKTKQNKLGEKKVDSSGGRIERMSVFLAVDWG